MSEQFIPFIYWHQNKENIYLIMDIPDIIRYDCNFENDTLNVFIFGLDKNYKFNMTLYKPVLCDEVKYTNSKRNLQITLPKKENEFWDRLTLDRNELKNHIRINWDLWVDEDDEEDKNDNDDGDNVDYKELMEKMMGMNNFMDSENIEEDDDDNNDDDEDDEHNYEDANEEESEDDKPNEVNENNDENMEEEYHELKSEDEGESEEDDVDKMKYMYLEEG